MYIWSFERHIQQYGPETEYFFHPRSKIEDEKSKNPRLSGIVYGQEKTSYFHHIFHLVLPDLRYLLPNYLPQNNRQRSRATKETNADKLRQFERFLPMYIT